MTNIDSNEILHYIFDSKTKVKILKFMFRNHPGSFSIKDISKVIVSMPEYTQKEVVKLISIGLIRSKVSKIKNEGEKKSESIGVYYLNSDFDFFEELRGLLLKSSLTFQKRMLKKIIKLGRIKFVAISGLFLNMDDSSTTDILIVGDGINKKKFNNFLKITEAEVGKEINFAIMDREEFDYRRKMFDRFIRVLFESPHKVLMDKIGVRGT